MDRFESAAASTATGEGLGQLSIRDILDTLSSHRYLAMGILAAVTILGTLYALIATPIYQADVLIQVEDKKGTTLEGVQQLATALDVSQSPTPGEIEILKSREVIAQAIQALHLDIDWAPKRRIPYFASEFERKVGGRGISLASPRLGLDTYAWGGEALRVSIFDVSDDDLNVEFILRYLENNRWVLVDGKDGTVAQGEVGVLTPFDIEGRPAKILVDKVLARPGESFGIKKTKLIAVYRKVLNQIRAVEATRQSSVIRLTVEGPYPLELVSLANQIAGAYLTQNVQRRSEEAEKSLKFLEEQLPQLKEQVEKSEEAFNEYRLSRQSVNLDKEAESLLTRSVDLEKSRVEQEMRKQIVTQRFQPGAPEVVAVDGQLAELRQEQDRLAGAIKKLPETQQEFLRLQRDVNVNTGLYISLLNNSQQLKISKAGTIGNVRVIDFAIAPDFPTRPQRSLIVGLSAVVGLILGILAAFTARALKPTLQYAEELEKMCSAPNYATVPESEVEASVRPGRRKMKTGSKNGPLADTRPDDPAVEAIRGMQLGLKFAMVGARNKVVVISGPLPALGKTFVSTNLCVLLAVAGKRVLLIDADMRRPRIAAVFGLPRTPGLSDVLAGQVAIASARHVSVRTNLDILSSGTVPPNPGELLLQPTFPQLLVDMQHEYDYIIIDTPPILPVGDAITAAQQAGTVLLVVRAETTTAPEFIDAVSKLRSSGVSLKGTIFNGVKRRALGYGYRYQYYQSRYVS